MMRILSISDEAIHAAARVLHDGGVVVYPTETAYGFAADPFSVVAVRRVFELKGRSDGKPLGLVASSVPQVRMVAKLHADEERLTTHWPGPLSLVLDAKVPSNAQAAEAFALACAKEGTVSVRVSSNPWAQKLAAAVGRPITATSANRSGGATCYTIHDVLQAFADDPKPDLVLDAGDLPRIPTSTVVRVERGKLRILRQGIVTIQDAE